MSVKQHFSDAILGQNLNKNNINKSVQISKKVINMEHQRNFFFTKFENGRKQNVLMVKHCGGGAAGGQCWLQ